MQFCLPKFINEEVGLKEDNVNESVIIELCQKTEENESTQYSNTQIKKVMWSNQSRQGQIT